MTFPKIDYPILVFEAPTTGKKLRFRPIVVKEEKILLTAKAGDSESDIFLQIKQIVNNCCLEENFDVDDLSLLDLEYLFLKLRGYSIGNKITLSYKDTEDGETRDFEINLDDVQIVWPEDHKPNGNIIVLDENNSIKMRYPPASLYSNKEFLEAIDNDEMAQEVLLNCIVEINNHKINHETEKEQLIEFVDNLEVKMATKLNEFFDLVPRMEYKISYTNNNGTEREIVLSTLNDFFMLL